MNGDSEEENGLGEGSCIGFRYAFDGCCVERPGVCCCRGLANGLVECWDLGVEKEVGGLGLRGVISGSEGGGASDRGVG